ncbi:MAG: hypothetical protein IJU52_07535 [Clostridia bacterium]|nr:hypothetical protein [Clostridia bacterium]
MKKYIKAIALLAAAAIFALTLASCGNGGTETTSPAQTTANETAAPTAETPAQPSPTPTPGIDAGGEGQPERVPW